MDGLVVSSSHLIRAQQTARKKKNADDGKETRIGLPRAWLTLSDTAKWHDMKAQSATGTEQQGGSGGIARVLLVAQSRSGVWHEGSRHGISNTFCNCCPDQHIPDITMRGVLWPPTCDPESLHHSSHFND